MPGYCKRCRLHIPDGMSSCRMCGSSVLTEPPPPPSIGFPDSPREASEPGFSKWLAFVALSLIAAPAARIYNVIDVDVPTLFTEPGRAYLMQHPGLDGVYWFEIGMNALLVFTAVALNVLFYRRSDQFPKWMVAYLALTFLFRLAIAGALHALFPGAVLISSAYSLMRYALWAMAAAGYLLLDSDVERHFRKKTEPRTEVPC